MTLIYLDNAMIKKVLLILLSVFILEIDAQENIEEIIIDSGAVKGTTQPIVVHSKNKTKPEKSSAA